MAYLTALGTEKHDQMRIQGVIYGLGAVALLAAHIGSGVLNAQTWPFSALLILPVMLGVWLGSKVMDRVDPVLFRKMTLLVLMVARATATRAPARLAEPRQGWPLAACAPAARAQWMSVARVK